MEVYSGLQPSSCLQSSERQINHLGSPGGAGAGCAGIAVPGSGEQGPSSVRDLPPPVYMQQIWNLHRKLMGSLVSHRFPWLYLLWIINVTKWVDELFSVGVNRQGCLQNEWTAKINCKAEQPGEGFRRKCQCLYIQKISLLKVVQNLNNLRYQIGLKIMLYCCCSSLRICKLLIAVRDKFIWILISISSAGFLVFFIMIANSINNYKNAFSKTYIGWIVSRKI